MTGDETRPPLDAGMSAGEFARWYWLKRELAAFARELGVSAAGGKQEIAARIAARLAGDPDAAPRTSPARRAGGRLSGELSRETIVPDGQPMTADVRAFMVRECGPGFRFDRHMRAFFAGTGGRTLGDAVDYWFATRNLPAAAIEPQFEYNRFVREWRAEHPGAAHAEVTAAWQARRALPGDRRPDS